jgi:hypothetical protein
MTTENEITDNQIIGPWRTPVNIDSESRTNIHNNEDAKKLGFRGGLVAGSIHMEMFMPVMLEAFGEAWFERGNLSLYFMNATLDGEEVRAVAERPAGDRDSCQGETFGERPDGTVLGKGTAGIGAPNDLTALRTRDLSPFPPGELRILKDVRPGDTFPTMETPVTSEYHQERLQGITEMMPWYTDASRWGGLVASPVTFVDALADPSRAWVAERNPHPVVGMFGAIEMRYINGPMLVDVPYRCEGHVLAVGQSPKTEHFWYDSHIDDENGKRIADMRMMVRYVKASSKLYNENATTYA